MLASKLLSPIGNTDKLYVDDVFSAYTYTGNGSTKTINNGIDLAGKGGLVWIKDRNASDSGSINLLFDTTASSPYLYLVSNTTSGRAGGSNNFQSFNANGFTLGNDFPNWSGRSLISWTFRKAPKFFDIVAYTGNGVAGRQIPHALGVAPGMIVIKRTNAVSDWRVWHKNLTNASGSGNTKAELALNLTSAEASSNFGFVGDLITSSNFAIGSGGLNNIGDTYVAYLFAHDTAADGIVQCGSVTGTGAVSVDLGWEPQFVMIKCSSDSSNWHIFDTSRGMTVDNTLTGGEGKDKRLSANSASAEVSQSSIEPTATGFKYIEFGSPQTFVYLAIRRPNKPPTTGTQVYNAIARTGTSAAATVTGVGFAPDLVVSKRRDAKTAAWFSRLSGPTKDLESATTSAELVDTTTLTSFDMDGFSAGIDSDAAIINNPYPYINWVFKRAPGFFDVVCYTGDGNTSRILPHSLAAVPEMFIVKSRSTTGWWTVGARVGTAYGADTYTGLFLQTSAAASGGWGEISKSAAGLSTTSVGIGYIGNKSGVGNTASVTYVAYLFASLPGISKVGSYTGNGSSQTINCGFSTGARFILIKRTDSAGDWYVWDTARGIVSANDPHLSLNTTAAEVTSNDSVDPDSTGFIVNQVTATNINVTGSTYLYLAIA